MWESDSASQLFEVGSGATERPDEWTRGDAAQHLTHSVYWVEGDTNDWVSATHGHGKGVLKKKKPSKANQS